MPSTTNFGWTTPADTDLVKDGAAAIRTLGNGVDASFVDLKGGTTGQILSKNSNTDLDFTWIANDQGDITAVTAGTGMTGGGTSGAVTLTNDMATTITAAGDIVVGTGSGTYDNLAIGTTGQVLTADTTVSPYKVKWAAVSGGDNWSLLNTGGTALTGATTITVTGISGKDKIMVLVNAASTANGGADIGIRLNTDTGSNYTYYGFGADGSSSYSSGIFFDLNGTSTNIPLGGTANTDHTSRISGYGLFTGCNSSGVKVFQSLGGADNGAGGTGNESFILGGYYNSSSAISSISIYSASGNFDNGDVFVYTSA